MRKFVIAVVFLVCAGHWRVAAFNPASRGMRLLLDAPKRAGIRPVVLQAGVPDELSPDEEPEELSSEGGSEEMSPEEASEDALPEIGTAERPEVFAEGEAIPEVKPADGANETDQAAEPQVKAKTIPMVRVDRVLVERGLAASRNEAAALIKEGRVSLKKKSIKKGSQKIPINARLMVTDLEGSIVEYGFLPSSSEGSQPAPAPIDPIEALRSAHVQEGDVDDMADILARAHSGMPAPKTATQRKVSSGMPAPKTVTRTKVSNGVPAPKADTKREVKTSKPAESIRHAGSSADPLPPPPHVPAADEPADSSRFALPPLPPAAKGRAASLKAARAAAEQAAIADEHADDLRDAQLAADETIIDVVATNRALSGQELEDAASIFSIAPRPELRQSAASRAARFGNKRQALSDMREASKDQVAPKKKRRLLPNGEPMKRYSKKYKWHIRDKGDMKGLD